MGGSATKQYGTERIPNDHFANIVATINSFNRPITVVKVYAKPDHGDIDVIVNRVQDRDFLVQRLKLHDIVKNGNVWSCVYNYADRKYQIDIIYCESKFANEWYSYGNMSLLIGRIIPEKLKFAFDGLRLRYSNVVIKSDFFEALEFLGLDVERFKRGFKHRVEMLDWLAAGKYFNHAGLEYNWRNAQSRHRDSKRTSLTEEIDYLLSKPTHGPVPKALLNRYHYLDVEFRKKTMARQMAVNRAKKTARRYFLDVGTTNRLKSHAETNPKQWMRKTIPVELDLNQCIALQRFRVVNLLRHKQLTAKLDSIFDIDMAVSLLYNNGCSKEMLVQHGISPRFLKGLK